MSGFPIYGFGGNGCFDIRKFDFNCLFTMNIRIYCLWPIIEGRQKVDKKYQKLGEKSIAEKYGTINHSSVWYVGRLGFVSFDDIAKIYNCAINTDYLSNSKKVVKCKDLGLPLINNNLYLNYKIDHFYATVLYSFSGFLLDYLRDEYYISKFSYCHFTIDFPYPRDCIRNSLYTLEKIYKVLDG